MATETADKITVSLDMDPEVHEALQLYAAKQATTVSAVMTQAITRLAEDIEDAEDVNAFFAEESEDGIPLDDFMAQLKRDGKL